MAVPSPHQPLLEAAGVPDPAVPALALYLDRLGAWSARLNLTAARTPGERVRVLVAPVLPALPLVSGPLLDVGSGNGSPGLVLALLRPELPATLLEPRARRWAFLREAARAAGRPEVAVVRARHDEYRGTPAATVTLRALALPLGELAPLVGPGGRVLYFGGSPALAPGFWEEPAPPGIRLYGRR